MSQRAMAYVSVCVAALGLASSAAAQSGIYFKQGQSAEVVRPPVAPPIASTRDPAEAARRGRDDAIRDAERDRAEAVQRARGTDNPNAILEAQTDYRANVRDAQEDYRRETNRFKLQAPRIRPAPNRASSGITVRIK